MARVNVTFGPRRDGVLIIADVARNRIPTLQGQIVNAFLRRNAAPLEGYAAGELLLKHGRWHEYDLAGEWRCEVVLELDRFEAMHPHYDAAFPLHDLDALLQELFRRETWRERPPLF